MNLWCDRIITGGILFLVLCTPFAFGSVHPWAYSTMGAVILCQITSQRVQDKYAIDLDDDDFESGA